MNFIFNKVFLILKPEIISATSMAFSRP